VALQAKCLAILDNKALIGVLCKFMNMVRLEITPILTAILTRVIVTFKDSSTPPDIIGTHTSKSILGGNAALPIEIQASSLGHRLPYFGWFWVMISEASRIPEKR
jgi:hypothetical protein